MKICIVGLGGVGGFYGGMLVEAGCEVAAVVSPRAVTIIRREGLKVSSVTGTSTYTNIEVSSDLSDINDIDCLIVATKHYHLDDVAEQLLQYNGKIGVIVTLQNGLDADIRLAKRCPNHNVVAGCVYVVSRKEADGVICQTAGPRSIYFGEREYWGNPLLSELEHLFLNVGITAKYSSEITLELWKKFVWINAFAGITTAYRSAIGPLVNDDSIFGAIENMVQEIFAVAHADGVALSEKDYEDIISKFRRYKTEGQNAKSSLLVDIENGSECEVDSLLGELIRRAENYKIPLPIAKSLYLKIINDLVKTV